MEDMEMEIEQFRGKETEIIQKGFVNSYYTIKKLKFIFKYDMLNIIDELSSNYLEVNLNQVYKIENNIDKIKLYLDNDIELTLKIKRHIIKTPS